MAPVGQQQARDRGGPPLRHVVLRELQDAGYMLSHTNEFIPIKSSAAKA
jgi:hypothetical protein